MDVSLARRSLLPALIVFGLLALVEYGIWTALDSSNRHLAQERFQREAADVAGRIRQRMSEHEQALRGTAGLFLASRVVTPDEWRAYVNLLKLNQSFPGIQSIGYAERVAAAQLPAFEQHQRSLGQADFTVHPPGQQPEYYPITRVESFDAEAGETPGFDLYSVAANRAAMDQARQKGTAALTGPVPMPGSRPLHDKRVRLFWPLYVEGRDPGQLGGFVYGTLAADQLMEGIAGEHLSLVVEDITDAAHPLPLFDNGSIPDQHLFAVQKLEVGERLWRISVRSAAGAQDRSAAYGRLQWLGLGLLTNLLLCSVIGANLYYRQRNVDLERAQVDLTAQREKLLRHTFDSMPNGVLLADGNGRIRLVNAQLCRIFGYTEEELLGQGIELLVADAQRDLHQRLREDFMLAPRQIRMSEQRQLAGRHKQGHEIQIEVILSPVEQGPEPLVLAVVIDIGKRLSTERLLREQAEEIRRSSQYKSEFVANISHELRTPLNSILILSEQLRRNAGGRLSEREQLHADVIHKSGSDLLHMINDLLDISKIEAGHLKINIAPIDLIATAQSAVAAIAPLAKEKGLSLQLDTGACTQPLIHSDDVRIAQILRNLLSNAVKFTDHGGITLTVASRRREDGSAVAELAVADTGIGIEPDNLQRIFEAFQQADGSTSRRYGGTGLGLTISRQLAQLLGGHISVASTRGQGSCFTLSVPSLANPAHEPAAPLPPARTEAPPHAAYRSAPGAIRHRALLLDGDIRDIYAMSTLLDALGVDAIPARNAGEAMTVLERGRVDIILLDLPLTAAEQGSLIDLLHRHSEAPMILLAPSAAHAASPPAGGPDAELVTKPVDPEALRAALGRLLPSESE